MASIIRPYLLGGGLIVPHRRLVTAISGGPSEATASVDWALMSLNGPQATLQVNEIEFLETWGGSNVATGGTGRSRYTSAVTGSTLSTDNACFDGNASAGVNLVAGRADAAMWAYELPSAKVIRSVKIRGASTASATPYGFLVLVSYDGRTTWNPVHVIAETSWAANTWKTYEFDPTVWLAGTGRNAARAWRILVSAWQGTLTGAPHFGDVAFAETAGGATLCTGGAPLQPAHTSQSTFSSLYAALAFNGDNRDGCGISGTNRALGYVFPAPVNVTELRIKSLDWTALGAPTTFDVQWSTDIQNWTTALSVSGITWSANETKTWTIP